ncbi:protein of unknown function [Belliella buryatensis]|uniref:DUF4136 domain-containing protein n=1 Tax=Belliella buryatensis TaxID=1500549 RepID=A0A239ACK7_9BACT|nr:DUF4136 domain-containing protein [Belliella buryatensis]SNR93396.1 protein of unknown function [Belliella buryatensis]
MKLNKPTLLLSLLLFNISCSSIEIYKENIELSPYKENRSYMILNKENNLNGVADDLLNEKIIKEIEFKMMKLGLYYDSNTPDLIIEFSSNEEPRNKEIFRSQYPLGPPSWNSYSNDARISRRQNTISFKDYEVIQLVMDFIDPSQDKMYIRVMAVTEVSSIESKYNLTTKSVGKIIKAYDQHMNQN